MNDIVNTVAPSFVRVDLTELQDEGVLMAANTWFFWPLGLALTWDHEDGTASNLHVREWTHEPGRGETIGLAADDPTGIERRARFDAWIDKRLADMLPEEAAEARIRLGLKED
jgi:hypothetical protein